MKRPQVCGGAVGRPTSTVSISVDGVDGADSAGVPDC